MLNALKHNVSIFTAAVYEGLGADDIYPSPENMGKITLAAFDAAEGEPCINEEMMYQRGQDWYRDNIQMLMSA